MMVSYTHNSKTLCRLWNPEFQRVKAQSEVVFDEERNAHMSCQHESNEIDIFELPEDEEYVEKSATGDEPLRDSQPTQIGKRSKSHMHKAPDEEAENAHSRRLRTRLPSVRQQMQKTSPTAGASAERTTLPSVLQQMQKTSPTAGASAERIRLPGARQQQSRNQAESRQQLQLQLRR